MRLCAPPPEPHTDPCPDLSRPGLPLRGARHIGLIVFWRSPLWLRACVRWAAGTEGQGNNIRNCCRELKSMSLYLAKCCETWRCVVVTAEWRLWRLCESVGRNRMRQTADFWILCKKKGRLGLKFHEEGRKFTVRLNAFFVYLCKSWDCRAELRPQHRRWFSSCIPKETQGRARAGRERASNSAVNEEVAVTESRGAGGGVAFAKAATRRAGRQHKAWSEHRSALLQGLSAPGQWRQHSYCGSSS